MNSPKTYQNTECAFDCTKQDCVAKEGCDEHTTEEQLSWKERIMQHFMKVE